MSDDFDFETKTGLPAQLRSEERIMWQGRPELLPLARRAFHIDKIAVYFVALVAIRLMVSLGNGQDLGSELSATAALLVAAALAIAVLMVIAWQSARTTVYTLTTKRVVMRSGIALPITLNIPLTQVAAAELALRADKTGDIALAPVKGTRLAYLMLWPHVRAWRINHPEPTIRCIADAKEVAQLVGEALQETLRDDGATNIVRIRVLDADEAQPTYRPHPQLTAAE